MKTPKGSPDQRLRALAARQYGVVSREQALAAGLPPDAITWRLRAGEWTRVLPVVYALAGTPGGWPRPLMAAQLWAGPSAVVSHRAAAGLFELQGVPIGTVELLTTASRSYAPAGIKLHRSGLLPRREWGLKGQFRVTSPIRTLIDLAAVVDPITWEVAAESAFRKDDTILCRLADRVAELSPIGWRGLPTIRAFLASRDPNAAPSESFLETLFLHLFADCGLPDPVRQYEVYDEAGYIVRIDFAFPAIKLAILTDGYETHMGRRPFERDRRTANRLALQGWMVLYITWKRLMEAPEQVKTELLAAHAARVAAS